MSSVESSNPPAPAALSVWFALFYFAYYFFSWTCTMIPCATRPEESKHRLDEEVQTEA